MFIPQYSPLFFEVNKWRKWTHVEAFNPYCSGKIKENVKSAGYCLHKGSKSFQEKIDQYHLKVST